MKNWFQKNKKYGYILIFVVSFLLLIASLFDFSKILSVNETKRGYQELERSAKNHSLIIENRINQYFLVLEKDALLLQEEEFTVDRIREALENIKELPEMDFDCLGIADKTGSAVLSTGEAIQIKDERFFKEAMSGENYILMETREDILIVVAGVPIFDTDGAIKGVLFGKMPLEGMGLFEQFTKEERKEHLQLLDEDGNCIWNISGQKKRGEIVVKTPIANSNLYLYEGTDRGIIDQTVRYYQKDMLYLTIKILTISAVLIGVYIYYSVKERKHIQNLYAELCLNEEVYRITAEHSNQCIFTYDPQTKQIQFMNEKYKDLGFTSQYIEIPGLLKTLEHESLSTYRRVEKLVSSVKDHIPKIEKELLVTIGGQNRCLRVLLVNLVDENQLLSRSLGMIEDITEQKENAMMIKREQNFRKSLLADCLGYLEVNLNEDMIVENSFDSGNTENTRGSFTKLIEYYVSKKVLPEYREDMLRQMSKQTIRENFRKGIFETVLEYQTLEADGNIYWIACDIRTKQAEDKKELTAYLVYRNIDEKKKEQMKLEEEATRDALTGALKRKIACENINYLLKKPLTQGQCHVFMMLDMDNFKTLNDTLGHMCGDQALIDIVKTAKENCRQSDIVCRLGGDEFIIFLTDVTREGVTKKAESLLKEFQATYQKDGVEVTTTVSIGIALAPDHGNCFDDLYAAADKALYKVKTSQKGAYCVAK